MRKNTRIAIVDDDPEFQGTVAECLQDEPSFRLICSCDSGEEALEVLPRQKPDIVLMDINMKGMSGIECVRQLKRLLPSTHVVMLTVFEDTRSIFPALAAGANGYLLKRFVADRLIDSIQEVLGGGAPMSAPIARMVVKSLQTDGSNEEELQLTAREREVLDGLARGLAYKQIAAELDISMGTIRTHIERIYEKLHVHNRTDAVVKYLRSG
jgi:DNA-binding NarL/FixJ family response regulator